MMMKKKKKMMKKKQPLLFGFKIGYFGLTVGISAQAVLWQGLATLDVFGIPSTVHEIFWFWGLITLLLSLSVYTYKAFKWPYAVLREILSPVRANFFFMPTLTTTFLLLSCPVYLQNVVTMKIIFFLVLSIDMGMRLLLWGEWLVSHELGLSRVYTPAMLSVINCFMLAKLAVNPIFQLGQLATGLVAIGLGFFFIILVQTFGRRVGDFIPPELLPSLFFYMAPLFAVAAVWPKLPIVMSNENHSPSFDETFGVYFFYLGLFLYVLLLRFVNSFCVIRFDLTWWAYTFPTAAAGITAIQWSNNLMSRQIFALVLSIISTLLVSFNLIAMLQKVIQAKSFHPLLPQDCLCDFALEKELLEEYQRKKLLGKQDKSMKIKKEHLSSINPEMSIADHLIKNSPWKFIENRNSSISFVEEEEEEEQSTGISTV